MTHSKLFSPTWRTIRPRVFKRGRMRKHEQRAPIHRNLNIACYIVMSIVFGNNIIIRILQVHMKQISYY